MKRLLTICALSLGSFLFLLTLSDPNRLPAFMLIIPFILLAIGLLSGLIILLHSIGMSRKKSLRLSILITSFPILLALLQSTGQLTVRDFIILVALFGIAYFYMVRMGFLTE